LATVWLIFCAARVLYPDRPELAILAEGIAALTPTHIALTSTVNNDALLELCFTGTLFVLVCAQSSGFTQRRAVLLGIWIGCAILTKATGLLLLPIGLAAVLFIKYPGTTRIQQMRNGAVTLIPVLVISGWWFIRNQILYGELLPLHAFTAAFAGTMPATKVVSRIGGWGGYLLVMGQGTFQSYWAVMRGTTPEEIQWGIPRFLPDPVYVLLGAMTIASAIGMSRLVLRRRVEFTRNQRNSMVLIAATFGLVCLAFLLFILKYFQMQGRYLFPAMLPICMFLALGWLAVFPHRHRMAAAGLLLAFLGVICVLYALVM
jgi:4-amino-4-deoxy-L-arabinose transferase-like glycosyltransferase